MLTVAILAALIHAAPVDTSIVLRNARVLDVRTGKSERTTLVIDKGVISARGANPSYDRSATVIAADSFTVLAGLIDTHVHFTIGGRPGDNALNTLKKGFTTVADLGSAGGGGVRLQQRIEKDSIAGPRMIAAGSWIGGRGGVCEFGGATVRGAVEARSRAAADVIAGAGVLKLCVSNWLQAAAQFPDSVEMTSEEIAAVVDEAKRAGIPVVAHALSQAAVLAMVRAGVTWLAHTPLVSEPVARELAQRNVCVSTTMTSLGANDSNGALRSSFDRLRRVGVRLVLGTDAGVVPHGSNASELTTLMRHGFTALEAIQAATWKAAECLQIPGYGGLNPGDRADLVAVRGDPLADITALANPALVIKAGRIVR
jgi:imidazolonepropionase-like amidohydrolase